MADAFPKDAKTQQGHEKFNRSRSYSRIRHKVEKYPAIPLPFQNLLYLPAVIARIQYFLCDASSGSDRKNYSASGEVVGKSGCVSDKENIPEFVPLIIKEYRERLVFCFFKDPLAEFILDPFAESFSKF